MKNKKKKRGKEKKNWMRFRVFLVLLAFVGSFVIITFRAYQLQVIQREKLEKLANRQRQKVATLLPRRGIIYDRHGEELAISIDVDSLYCHPDMIEKPEKLVAALSGPLGMSRKEIRKKVTSSKGFVWLKRRLSPDVSARIRKLDLREIGIIRERRRYYPNTELAGHLLGFVGLDSQGLEGIELIYDDLLKGKAEEVVMERDALGRTLHVRIDPFHKGTAGHNLILTIDRSIQYITEEALERAVNRTDAKGGIAIVMDPNTGEILAMANRPSFNPNTFWTFRPYQWRNRAVTDAFEPGSTFKIFLAAAALEEGIAQPDTPIFCENGSMKLAGKTIKDHNNYGWLPLKGIIRVSSNIGAAKIGMQLGPEKFYKHIRNFGFGQKGGINLPGETLGLVRDYRKWVPINLANISFGQGISASAIQLITALSAIANGGHLMVPYVVKEITDNKGNLVKKFKPKTIDRVLSAETSRTMKAIMLGVVSQNGTGKEAAINGIAVAGKTGTAQKVDLVRGGYRKGAYISSFIGFVPAHIPKMAILVMIDEPKGLPYGGKVAAPVFREIAENALNRMGIFPKERMIVKSLIR